MLPEETGRANSRYFYELASGMFGWELDKVRRRPGVPLQARPGRQDRYRSGHLPGIKVNGKIAEVRGLARARRQDAISPSTFARVHLRGRLSAVLAERGAGHVGRDPDRGQVVRPTHRGRHRRCATSRGGLHHPRRPGRRHRRRAHARLPRQHLGSDDPCARPGAPASGRAGGGAMSPWSITGWVAHATPTSPRRSHLGADAVAVSNAAMQAIGCIGMRACNSDQQLPGRDRNPDNRSSESSPPRRRGRSNASSPILRGQRTELMGVLARACGHHAARTSSARDDLTTFDREMAHLTGIAYGGVGP